MGRKNFILIFSVAALLVIAAVTYFTFNKAGINTGTVQAEQSSTEDTQAAVQEDAAVQTAASDAPIETAVQSEVLSILKSEDIEVKLNSPEYDLKVSLYEDSSKQTFLKLEYYIEGVGTVNEIDSAGIPEIKDIFEKRSKSPESNAYKIMYAYLNTKFSKLYLFINNNVLEDIVQTSIYTVNLQDSPVKRLLSTQGKFTVPAFNKDLSLLAYSYFDSPLSSVFQEKILFEVIDCKTDDFVIKGSRDKAGSRIGNDRDSNSVYDYSFISWKSNNSALLKQGVWSKSDAATITDTQTDVLFDIAKNRFFNTDGSEIKPDDSNMVKPGSTKAPAESEALKVLKSFYAYLSSENDYSKAMELLDPDFKLQLELLKQFGTDYIIKSDIDVGEASIYGDILKAAKLDSIIKEEQKDGIYTIYYNQILAMNADSQIQQAMTAQIKKRNGSWKITLIKDTDTTVKTTS
jgi:hypothetical protein